ncbi:MAG: HD domain-containing protein [Treponema sp.]|nr:HD domain-containing protein [Treponema sp.]
MEAISNITPRHSDESLQDFIPQQQLSAGQILCIIGRMLVLCNETYGLSSCRVAYLASEIAAHVNWDKRINISSTILLALFKNVGDYHFDSEKVINYSELTAHQIKERYMYSYAFLKNLTPLGEDAHALLFYDSKYNAGVAEKMVAMEYASIIFTAERIMELLETTNYAYTEIDFEKFGLSKYNPKYVEIFKIIDGNREISKNLRLMESTEGNVVLPCIHELEKLYLTLKFNKDETDMLFKLMILVLDFKSTVTVWHTIHTAGYAVSLGKYAGCSETELNEIFTAGALHDLGKIGIPQSILEYPGKLRNWEYNIIKHHVDKTEDLIIDLIPRRIANMAIHHHEKLNGTGYPRNLSGLELTKEDQIVEIADILSALVDRRSYKEEFNSDTVIQILKEMAQKGELDEKLTMYIYDCFERIQERRDFYSKLLVLPLGTVEIEFQEEMYLESGIE